MSFVPLKIVPSPCATIKTLLRDPDLRVDQICSFCSRGQEGNCGMQSTWSAKEIALQVALLVIMLTVLVNV